MSFNDKKKKFREEFPDLESLSLGNKSAQKRHKRKKSFKKFQQYIKNKNDKDNEKLF